MLERSSLARRASGPFAIVCVAGCQFFLAFGAVAREALTIEVSAGKYDRHDTPVAWPLPESAAGWRAAQLLDAATRRPVPADIDRSTAPPVVRWIVTEPLKAGQSRRYLLAEAKDGAGQPDPEKSVRVANEDGDVHVTVDGQPVLIYHALEAPSEDPKEPAYRRSGFIHPLYDPAGGVVTDGMPPDHMHQHGLFMAWVNTTFEGRNVDFWNSAKHLGEVRGAACKDLASGSVSGSFTACLEHVDITAPGGQKTALVETWVVRVYAHAGGYLFDIESTQNCAGESPLEINRYLYGGMALRGARAWYGERPCEFLTSEGKHRADGNHTRPRWLEMFGDLADHKSGVAVLCHPANFRFPQPVRLHPDKPYFCFAPTPLGEFAIEPGKPYVSKYRYYVHAGEPNPALNDALWNDFAEPPAATLAPQ